MEITCFCSHMWRETLTIQVPDMDWVSKPPQTLSAAGVGGGMDGGGLQPGTQEATGVLWADVGASDQGDWRKSCPQHTPFSLAVLVRGGSPWLKAGRLQLSGRDRHPASWLFQVFRGYEKAAVAWAPGSQR